MPHHAQLHQAGYVLLRQVVPEKWLDELRRDFETGMKPSEQWPVPRASDWRHSHLDCAKRVQAVCRLPQLLAAVGALIGERFFLYQVEGRAPVAGGGHQALHRDLSTQRPGDTVGVMVYLDDYGPDNGATRIVPGSHRPVAGEPPFDYSDESRSLQLAGRAGDALVFDVDLVHAASLNASGAQRRSLLIGYAAEPLFPALQQTAHLRNVQMDTQERFEPSDYVFTTPRPGAWHFS
ncbi:phytanoyl-CoA dioxygenase family protein [Pseudomonas carassii]|uniref:Phytanoyl-CoA dioxygenase family protein n=1 Tax=Pseudomonas carassii TaxID=3115855 RepID=A0ABU7HH52_9PSED|nr:phytanoyl-CoA dioxygenase family protein [Pseudomonas sp. 137P]MEE1890252.1 phytanoyl-CoA dioxygenase family protein [Pseudomonas sp. 137P]